MSANVLVDRGRTATVVTMSVPHRRNALSLALLRHLRDVLGAEIEAGPVAVVLTGAGETFSAGADLRDIDGTSEDVAMGRAVEGVTEVIRSSAVPVIAAIEGPCIGAAVDVALACDARVASTSAFFEVPATRLGLLYDPVAVGRWARELPRQTLVRLLVVGERLAADEALAGGVITRVCRPGGALQEALALCECAARGEPEARAATTALVRAAYAPDFRAEPWQELQAVRVRSPERAERVRAAQTTRKGRRDESR